MTFQLNPLLYGILTLLRLLEQESLILVEDSCWNSLRVVASWKKMVL